MSNIEIGTKVVAPVTDKEGEVSYVVGILTDINSRIATITDSEGKITKVGKTKIELFVPPVEAKPKKDKVDPSVCSICKSNESVFDTKTVGRNLKNAGAPYASMTHKFWCQDCDNSWGPAVGGSREATIDSAIYGYEKVKAASGRNSLDNGDETAQLLRGKSLMEVYHIASEVCSVTVAVLVSSYEHLNPGHQRMVLGNRVRKILKGRSSNPVKA